MRYIAAVLIAAFVAVECLPRPGLSSPSLSAPTSLDGRDSTQSGISVEDNGDVKVTQSKKTTSETNQERSESSAQGFDHTGPNGDSVSQTSEKNSAHSESEKSEENESKSVAVGQGGLAFSEDRSTTSDRREENSESGRQTYKQTSEGNPKHKSSIESGSEYKNSNETHDRHHDESHDKLAVGPDLQTTSEHKDSSLDQHDERQKAEGSSDMKKDDFDKDGKRTRHTSSNSQNAYKNEAAKSTSTATANEDSKSSKNNEETNAGANTNSGTDGEAEGGINGGTVVDAGMGAEIDAETDGGISKQSNAGLDARTDDETSDKREGNVINDKNEQTDQSNKGGQIEADSNTEAQTYVHSGQTNTVVETGGQAVQIGQTVTNGSESEISEGTKSGSQMAQTDGGGDMGDETGGGENVGAQTDGSVDMGGETGGGENVGGQTGGGVDMGAQTAGSVDMGAQAASSVDMGAQTASSVDMEAQTADIVDMGAQAASSVDMGTQTASSADMGAQIASSVDMGAQAASSVDMGAQTASSVYMGAQAASSVDMGAQTASSVDMGAQTASSVDMGAQAASSVDMGAQTASSVDMEAQTAGSVDMGGQTNRDAGIEAGSNVDANTGSIFHVHKDVHRQLDLNDRLLGLSQDGTNTSAAGIGVQSNRDFNKVKKDYLLAVAQSIHNARVVSDGKGHARFVSPNRFSARSRYSSPDSLDLIFPYRTLAQRYGPSPVSSHYANAQFVESNFGDLPSLLGFRDYEQQNTGSLHGAGKIKHAGKSQHGFQNLFKRSGSANYGHDEANLHLSPSEWEERARKKADLKKALLINRESKLLQKDKIHPLVKNVILSRNLDDILKGAQTSAEVSAAMKTAIGQTEKFFTAPMNKQKQITIKTNTVGMYSNENEIFGQSKDKTFDKSYYGASKTYDAPKDISQVIINKVHLDSFDNGFDSKVISGNIMDNSLDHSGFSHFGDIEGRENKVVYDSINYPRARIIANKPNVVDSFKYVNMENSYSTPKDESDTTEPSRSRSKFNSGDEEITTEYSRNKYVDDFYNNTESKTEKNPEITSVTEKTKVNFSSNDTTIANDNVEAQYNTNKTVESNSSLRISEPNYSNTADAASTDHSTHLLLTSTDESITESSIYATSHVLPDEKTESKSKLEVEKINKNINKTIGTFESKPEVNVRDSTNKSEIIYVDNASFNTSNVNLNTTSDTDKSNEETTTQTYKYNVSVSQDVNKEFENYEDSKSDETNKTNTNITEFFETDLSITNFNNSKARTIDGSYTDKINIAELEESVTNIPKIETKEESDNYSTEKSVDLNKRNLEETDISIDSDKIIKPDVQFEDSSNITVLIDKPVAVTVTESTDLTPVTDKAHPAEIDSNKDTSSISTNKTLSDVNINSSNNSNFGTAVVYISTTTENLNETAVTEKVSSDLEGSERLFARSALESNEEFNLENTTSIDKGTSNPSVADLDKSVSAPILNSNTYNATEITVKNETDLTNLSLNSSDIKNTDSYTTNAGDITIVKKETNTTKAAVNSTDDTDSLERTRKDLSALVEEPNSEANISDSQPFDNITVDTANITGVKATNSSKSTLKTTSTIDINTKLNLNKHVTTDSTIQDVTTVAKNDEVNDSKVKHDDKSETTNKLDTLADQNITNIASVDDKTPDSTVADKQSDESNLSGKEIVKRELNIDNLTSDAGSSNYTTITAANSTNATDVSTVNEATENRPVGDGDNTGKLLTVVKSDESQTSVKSNKSQTTENPQLAVENGNSQATVQSQKSEATIQADKSNATVKSNTPQKVKFDKPQETKSDKPQEAKPDKSQTVVKTDTFLATVKSDREKEESKKNKDDSTSKSDELIKSSSSERLVFASALDPANIDYSASISSE